MKQNVNQKLIFDLMHYIAHHPILEQEEGACATDDEVRAFIRIFMHPSQTSHLLSSYSLKHIAERTIGFLFHGSNEYSYVSNEQFKRIMREEEFSYFKPMHKGDNDYYYFKFTGIADTIFKSLGVCNTVKGNSLRDEYSL